MGLSLDSVLESGCLGNKGVVRLGVIETMRGGCDEDVTGGDDRGSGGSCDDDAT